jgi:predicted HTH transcriptional regulator
MDLIGIGETAIQNNISYLKKEGYIQRIGSNKNGYWKVLKAS